MLRGKIVKKPPVREATIDTSIHNKFDIEVVDAKTGNIKQRAQAFNVICNNLWSILFNTSTRKTYFNYIHYGTGSGTPSASDTSLFTYLGGKAVITSDQVRKYNPTTGIYYLRRRISILETENNGSTITEVGIASDSGQSTLCTHAMLQDMNGNQISIEKTSTDIINIYATIYIHSNPKGYDKGSIRLWYQNDIGLSGSTSFFKIFDGSATGLDGSACFNLGYNLGSKGYLGWKIAYPYGTLTGISYTFNSSEKSILMKVGRLPASNGDNSQGHGITRINSYYEHGSSYTTRYISMSLTVGGDWFPYSEIVGEAIGTGDGETKDFALNFNFAHDAKIFINGVETADFTLDYGIHYDEINSAMYMLEALDARSTGDNHIPFVGGAYSTYETRNWYTEKIIFYNKMYIIGIASITMSNYIKVEASNDLTNWEILAEYTSKSSKTLQIPEEYIHYKYFRLTADINAGDSSISKINLPASYTGKVLHFNTPPEAGAVITANYRSDTIAKDENHVFDLSVKIKLGEYSES